jgi:ferrous iron transport protein A
LRKVTDLKVGDTGIVKSFTDADLSLKLLEMGCLPGTVLTMSFVAPLGDPIGVVLHGHCLSMRIAEAATIVIE